MRTAPRRILVLLPLLAVSPRPTDGDARTLDARDAPYLEDEGTGRVLAMVHAELRSDDEGLRVAVRVSAEAPLVDAIPGYRGVRGANTLTARELGGLLADGRLAARTIDAGGRHVAGTLAPLRRARLPERRMAPDGKLLEHASTEEVLVELEARSAPLLETGNADFYLTVSGVPRLRVGLRVQGTSSRILDVESL